MSHKKYLPLLMVFTVLLLDGSTTHACSCISKPTVLTAYEEAGSIIVVRVVSTEKSAEHFEGISSLNMIVEQVFKGDLKVGDKMTFGQGSGGGDCIWTFSAASVGKRFLFYLRSGKETEAVWFAGICGRSNNLDYAGDDLLFLKNIEKLRGKTRLSGSLRLSQISPFENDDPIYKPLSGRKVLITGRDRSYELTTNSDGVYEIYDLPPGTYDVEPEIPAGWKLSPYGTHPSRFSIDMLPAKESEKNVVNTLIKPRRLNTFSVPVEAGKHSYLDFAYDLNNAMRGVVFNSQGNSLDGICLSLIPAQGKPAKYFYRSDCTKNKGAFEITNIPPGSYLLVVNENGRISSNQPFPTLYYPGVFAREKSTIITIGESEILADLNILVPKVEDTVTVSGVLLYSDGQPVVSEGVEFQPEDAGAKIDGGARTATDPQGHFSIKILKGLKGRLWGRMYIYRGKFENCPRLDKAAGDSTLGEVLTPEIEITADGNHDEVELKFPLPGCKRAKR